MSARLPNRSFSAPPEVHVLTLYAVSSPQRGQDASFPTPESTVGFN